MSTPAFNYGISASVEITDKRRKLPANAERLCNTPLMHQTVAFLNEVNPLIDALESQIGTPIGSVRVMVNFGLNPEDMANFDVTFSDPSGAPIMNGEKYGDRVYEAAYNYRNLIIAKRTAWIECVEALADAIVRRICLPRNKALLAVIGEDHDCSLKGEEAARLIEEAYDANDRLPGVFELSDASIRMLTSSFDGM